MNKTKNIEPPRGFGVIAYRQAKVGELIMHDDKTVSRIESTGIDHQFTINKHIILTKHSPTDYIIYHDTYSGAVVEALHLAVERGYTITDDDIFTYVGVHTVRPLGGETARFSLPLYRDDVQTNKYIHGQVYCGGMKYELTTYID